MHHKHNFGYHMAVNLIASKFYPYMSCLRLDPLIQISGHKETAVFHFNLLETSLDVVKLLYAYRRKLPFSILLFCFLVLSLMVLCHCALL